jgi:hypothetical protein
MTMENHPFERFLSAATRPPKRRNEMAGTGNTSTLSMVIPSNPPKNQAKGRINIAMSSQSSATLASEKRDGWGRY